MKRLSVLLLGVLVTLSLSAAPYVGRFDPGVMGPPATPAIVRAALAAVANPLPPGPFRPTWKSIEEHYRPPAWFENAKFGLFMHWGLYSVPAHHNEWYEKYMYGGGEGTRWHTEHYGPPDKFGYVDFIPLFTAARWNPDAWARLFKESGAKYVIPTAEHHDGFSLWNSAYNPWNAYRMGPKRDLIGDLAKAVRREGLKFGVSNHSIEHYTFINPPPGLKTDLHDPKYASFYWVDHSDANLTRFLTLWVEKNEELIDKYRPDILWFDNGVNGRVLDPLKETVAAYYYNRAREWGKQVSISTKGLAYAPSGDDRRQIGSIIDFEKIGLRSPGGIRPGPWQVDEPIGNTWGYTRNMRITGADTVVHELVDTVSRGGNLLLNISPRADGTIPAEQRETLLGVGRWLKVNGEAIYGTRPWNIFGEGDLRYTTKGDVLYVIALRWPGIRLEVPALPQGGPAGSVRRVELLGRSGDLDFKQEGLGLSVSLPAAHSAEPAYAFKISGLKLRPDDYSGVSPQAEPRFTGAVH